jgi:transcriptional regulator with XRE-family HTH domain
MPNKPKSQKPTDESIAIVDRAVKMATEAKDGEIARLQEKLSLSPWIFETVGKIKSMMFSEEQAKLFKILFLKRARESKDYRVAFGMTWEQFCKHVGVSDRTADDWLKDLEPLTAAFSAKFADFSGCDFNKIKYLAKAVSANIAEIRGESLVYQGEEIPLTPEHKDEIQALLEKLEESYKAQLEEKGAVIRTKEKLIQSQGDLIHRQEKTISKFEREAAKQGVTLQEDAFAKKVENLKIGFDGYMLSLDPDRIEELLPKNKPTPRMISAYISALKYMKMQICAAHDAAIESYADPSMVPDDEWQPPPDARAPVYPKSRSHKAEA